MRSPESTLNVELVYARPDVQVVLPFSVATGTTARQLVMRSGIEARFPEIDPRRCPLGIFGTRVADDRALLEGDRVEIYRPLAADPKDARRRRAAR
jgi:putative ubiquitin-RnfH superfamily antitoxin RatB of RatAB toxin-antitoxin module